MNTKPHGNWIILRQCSNSVFYIFNHAVAKSEGRDHLNQLSKLSLLSQIHLSKVDHLSTFTYIRKVIWISWFISFRWVIWPPSLLVVGLPDSGSLSDPFELGCDLNQAGYLSLICHLIQVGHPSQLVSEPHGPSESVSIWITGQSQMFSLSDAFLWSRWIMGIMWIILLSYFVNFRLVIWFR